MSLLRLILFLQLPAHLHQRLPRRLHDASFNPVPHGSVFRGRGFRHDGVDLKVRGAVREERGGGVVEGVGRAGYVGGEDGDAEGGEAEGEVRGAEGGGEGEVGCHFAGGGRAGGVGG